MIAVPLIVIPEDRKARELQRATDIAEGARRERLRFVLLVALCFAWVLIGFALVGLGLHLTDPDRAQVAFLGGILVAVGAPAWTLIIHYWIQNQG
jgi:hypothetical protein